MFKIESAHKTHTYTAKYYQCVENKARGVGERRDPGGGGERERERERQRERVREAKRDGDRERQREVISRLAACGSECRGCCVVAGTVLLCRCRDLHNTQVSGSKYGLTNLTGLTILYPHRVACAGCALRANRVKAVHKQY